MSIKIDVSFGELLDKITILEIKLDRIDDVVKIANVAKELSVLNDAWENAELDTSSVEEERQALKKINTALWVIEDDIRELEAAKTFGSDFISLARQVYQTNDQRAQVKRQVNEKLGSALTEEKSYQPY